MAKVKQIISYPSSLPTFKTCIHEHIDVYIIREVIPNARPVLSGYEGELLHLIADGLGVSLEYYVEEDGWFLSLPENASELTGCIGMVTRGEVDFTVSSLIQNFELANYANTSFPYLYLTVRFMTKLPDYVQKPFVFIEPFTTATWVLILLTLLVVSLAYYWMQSKLFSFSTQLFCRFAELITQSPVETFRVKSIITFPERILSGFWNVGAYFIALSYIAVILKFMIAPRRQPPLDNSDKLLSAVKRGDYKVGMPLEIRPFLLFMQNSINPIVKELSHQVIENGWEVSVTKDTFVNHLRDNFALATSELGLQLYNQRGFPVTISEDTIYSCNLAAFFAKNFPLREKFDYIILRIMETGLYTKLLDHYVFSLHLKDDARQFEEETIKPLTLKDFEGVFLLFAVGILLSFVVLLGETLNDKMVRKKEICNNEFHKNELQ